MRWQSLSVQSLSSVCQRCEWGLREEAEEDQERMGRESEVEGEGKTVRKVDVMEAGKDWTEVRKAASGEKQRQQQQQQTLR